MDKTFKGLVFLLLLCGLWCSGCAAGNARACRESKIFCGMSSKRGEVSEEAWRSFCDRRVSAAFPGGYTVVDAAGYWHSGQETTESERAKIIVIVAPADAREKVLSVARRYREEFGQEAVLVSASDAEVELVQSDSKPGEHALR